MRVVFAGSFDPPTMGHVDIVRRCANLFDRVDIVVGRNESKVPFLPIEMRLEMLQAVVEGEGLTSRVNVARWDGAIVEYAVSNNCDALVRCIRNCNDLPSEQAMASMNRRLVGIETLFLMVDREYADVSSSAVRELVSLKRLPAGIVPEVVRQELERRFGPF